MAILFKPAMRDGWQDRQELTPLTDTGTLPEKYLDDLTYAIPTDPTENARRVVRQMFIDYLRRDPLKADPRNGASGIDSGGLDFWTGQFLEHGAGKVEQAFKESLEYKALQTGNAEDTEALKEQRRILDAQGPTGIQNLPRTSLPPNATTAEQEAYAKALEAAKAAVTPMSTTATTTPAGATADENGASKYLLYGGIGVAALVGLSMLGGGNKRGGRS
jgi:hypothetical protein